MNKTLSYNLLDWQVEFFGELVIALVVRRDGHNGAGAVASQHVIGDPDWDFIFCRRIYGISASKSTAFDLFFAFAFQLRFVGSFFNVSLDSFLTFVAGNPFNQRMLGRQNHISRSKNGVRSGSKNFYFFFGSIDFELNQSALAAADPVFLHSYDFLRPI